MHDDRTWWEKFARWADDFWLRTITPHAQNMLNRYDWEWDRYVETALNLGMVKIIHYTDKYPGHTGTAKMSRTRLASYDQYICMVGPHEVWIGNYPYGYGNSYGGGGDHISRIRPRVRNLLRLRAEVERQFDEVRKAERAEFFGSDGGW